MTRSVVDIIDFGADPTESQDSYAAIQSAIDSLKPRGGIVEFPVGKYLISDDLNVGNGSDAGLSSDLGGVCLVGKGMPGNPMINGHNAPGTGMEGGAVLVAKNGFTSEFMLNLNGVQGWGIENLGFISPDCSALGAVGVFSSSFGECRNLIFTGFKRDALALDVFDIRRGLADSFHNSFDNLAFNCPDKNGANGLAFYSSDAGDVDYAVFRNTTIVLLANKLNASIGIKVTGGDNCEFFTTHMLAGGSSTVSKGVLFDYTMGDPSSFKFFGTDIIYGFANKGSYRNGSPHYVFGPSRTNNAPMPYNVPGIICYGPDGFKKF